MNDVDNDENNIPEECIEGTKDHPAPQSEEKAPDCQGDPQVKNAVDAIGGQVGQQEKCVGKLEVDVVDGEPTRADFEGISKENIPIGRIPDKIQQPRCRRGKSFCPKRVGGGRWTDGFGEAFRRRGYVGGEGCEARKHPARPGWLQRPRNGRVCGGGGPEQASFGGVLQYPATNRSNHLRNQRTSVDCHCDEVLLSPIKG